MSTKLAFLLSGGLGFLIVARTAFYYAFAAEGADGLAFLLVLVMAGVLGLGLRELWQRLGESESIAAEVDQLRARGALQPLETLSAGLAERVRASLEGAPSPSDGRTFYASFFVGLLVTLGLVGTFLGLFETIGGAREALASSGDGDALRAALGSPMRGLTRSFGTSAAGISASAMLGLATVIVRRREEAAQMRITAYAAGPAASLSTADRQLALLEQMVAQGQALPEAAMQLSGVTGRIEQLENTWARAQSEALREATGVVRAAVSQLQGDLKVAIENAGSSMRLAVAPLIEEAVNGTVQAATHHLGEILGAVETDFEKRRDREAALAEQIDARLLGISERLTRDAEERQAATQAQLDRFEQCAEQLTRSDSARGREIAAGWDGLRASLAAGLAGVTEGAEAQLTKLTAIEERLDAQVERSFAAVEEQRRQAAEVIAELGAQSVRLLDAQSLAREADAQAALAQREALDLLGAAADQRAELAEARLNETTRALLDAVSAGAASQSERLAAFEERIGELHAENARDLAKGLGEHAVGLGHQLQETAAVVREGSDTLKASGAELTAVAEMFSQSVDRQREGAQQWLENLGQVEAAVDRAGQGAAAEALSDTLASTHEVFARQIEFQRELFEAVRELRQGRTGGSSGAAAAG